MPKEQKTVHCLKTNIQTKFNSPRHRMPPVPWTLPFIQDLSHSVHWPKAFLVPTVDWKGKTLKNNKKLSSAFGVRGCCAHIWLLLKPTPAASSGLPQPSACRSQGKTRRAEKLRHRFLHPRSQLFPSKRISSRAGTELQRCSHPARGGSGCRLLHGEHGREGMHGDRLRPLHPGQGCTNCEKSISLTSPKCGNGVFFNQINSQM